MHKVSKSLEVGSAFSKGYGMVVAVIRRSKVGKVEASKREHLLLEEVEAMREAIRKAIGRHAHRHTTLILLMYRHDLRVGGASALQ